MGEVCKFEDSQTIVRRRKGDREITYLLKTPDLAPRRRRRRPPRGVPGREKRRIIIPPSEYPLLLLCYPRRIRYSRDSSAALAAECRSGNPYRRGIRRAHSRARS